MPATRRNARRERFLESRETRVGPHKEFTVKYSRLKKWLLAASGFAAFQVAGCSYLDQLRELFPFLPSP